MKSLEHWMVDIYRMRIDGDHMKHHVAESAKNASSAAWTFFGFRCDSNGNPVDYGIATCRLYRRDI